MTATTADRDALLRYLAVLAAIVTAVALLPSAPAQAQAGPSDPSDACPVEPGEAPFTDRDEIPEVHRPNVDCAAEFDIVAGFADNTYRPRLPVRRDQMASFIALTLDAAGVQLPAVQQDTFTDVPQTSVHADNINRLAAVGIVEGGPLDLGANEYGPALRTRRDQMTSFLMRAAGYAFADDVDAFNEDTQQFTDVPPGNVHFEKVNAAAVNELAQGVGGNLFAPSVATTRDQMASFVVRLLNFLAVPATVELVVPETATVAESATATATVRSQFGQPLPGAEVDFAATATAPVVPPSGTDTTDASGEATFDFTSAVPQTVTVTATVEGAGGNFDVGDVSDSAEMEFVAPDTPLDLAIDPLSGPAGAQGVTATFTGAAEDLANVTAIDIAGDCVEEATFDDTAFTLLNGDLGLDFDIQDPADEGDCSITFTVHFDDSTELTRAVVFFVTAP